MSPQAARYIQIYRWVQNESPFSANVSEIAAAILQAETVAELARVTACQAKALEDIGAFLAHEAGQQRIRGR